MNNVVLDSSVVLAVLRNETADAGLHALIEGAIISPVNLAEVLTKVMDDPLIEDDAADGLIALLASILPFGTSQARATARLRPQTKSAGLSLGDRACLALGAELDADIYTADRAWATLDLPLRIHVIR